MAGELVAEAAAAAVAEERDVFVLEAEDARGFFHAFVEVDDFGFAEMVAAAVAAELADFVFEVGEDVALVEEFVEADGEGVARAIVANVESIFAARGP